MPATIESEMPEPIPVIPRLVIVWEGFTDSFWWELLHLGTDPAPVLVVSTGVKDRARRVLPDVRLVEAGPTVHDLLTTIVDELGPVMPRMRDDCGG